MLVQLVKIAIALFNTEVRSLVHEQRIPPFSVLEGAYVIE